MCFHAFQCVLVSFTVLETRNGALLLLNRSVKNRVDYIEIGHGSYFVINEWHRKIPSIWSQTPWDSQSGEQYLEWKNINLQCKVQFLKNQPLSPIFHLITWTKRYLCENNFNNHFLTPLLFYLFQKSLLSALLPTFVFCCTRGSSIKWVVSTYYFILYDIIH